MGELVKRGIPAPTTFNSFRGTRVRVHNGGYTPGIAREICTRLMNMETLTEICNTPGMPTDRTVNRWLASPARADFREMYYYARRVQAERRVDEIFTIADNTEKDWKPVMKDGEVVDWKPDNEAIQRSRVRIDTRKWYASKLMPRIYGEKVEHNHDVVGDLADLMKKASNNDRGLPEPIEGEKG